MFGLLGIAIGPSGGFVPEGLYLFFLWKLNGRLLRQGDSKHQWSYQPRADTDASVRSCSLALDFEFLKCHSGRRLLN
jgi:hypothetical protein